MTGAYSFLTVVFVPPLMTAVLVALLGLYSLRRRTVPGARYFAGACLFWFLLLLGIAAEAAAVDPATRIAWHTFQALWQLPVATAITCFILEYVQPGRWLPRRNLLLLAVPPLLVALLLLTNPLHHLLWRSIDVDAGMLVRPALAGWLAVGYALLLAVLQAAALFWLFVQSPPHRWPAVLMLTALLLSRGVFLLTVTDLAPAGPLDRTFVVVLLPAMTYAAALFGFHLFDPLPAAHPVLLEQVTAGVVVFDAHRRVVSLNPAAERIFARGSAAAHGRRWEDLAPAGVTLPAFPATGSASPGAGIPPRELTLGSGAAVRRYAPSYFLLQDFRGQCIGWLLMLGDVTEERRAQAQIVEQQRALAVLQEREHLARELHDTIGQVLGYASLQVEAACRLLDDGRHAMAAGQLVRLAGVLQEAHADVREQILSLRAAPSPQQPFFAAVRHYLDGYSSNYAIAARLAVDEGFGEATLAPDVQLQLFRILQEALSNARKHSHAPRVQVTFAVVSDALCMEIEDDGCGFDPGGAVHGASHLGLQFMRERADEVGGSLCVVSAPGAGTRVAVSVPWKEK